MLWRGRGHRRGDRLLCARPGRRRQVDVVLVGEERPPSRQQLRHVVDGAAARPVGAREPGGPHGLGAWRRKRRERDDAKVGQDHLQCAERRPDDGVHGRPVDGGRALVEAS